MCCHCNCCKYYGYITRGVIEFIDLFIIILTIYDIIYINDTFIYTKCDHLYIIMMHIIHMIIIIKY